MSKIIAEIGVNHNGDMNLACKMIESAALAGTDVVKFQTFWGLKGLEKYEFTKDQWKYLRDYCNEFDVEFMTTPHWGSPICGYKEEDFDVIDFVDTLVGTHKVASPYLTNEKYLKYIAAKGKPIYLSTGSLVHKDGMASYTEIQQALYWLNSNKVTLLHCVSKYPSKGEYHRIQKLKLMGYPVGVSDHTKKISFPPLPVIEKHFKLNDDCIDANVSLNPDQFVEMVKFVRTYENIYQLL